MNLSLRIILLFIFAVPRYHAITEILDNGGELILNPKSTSLSSSSSPPINTKESRDNSNTIKSPALPSIQQNSKITDTITKNINRQTSVDSTSADCTKETSNLAIYAATVFNDINLATCLIDRGSI